MYDLITLGEAMIRFSPPDFERLEQAARLELRIGGAEWNVASNCARLGMSTAWVSRLTDNPLGWRIASEARAHGVDTRHIIWTDKDRIGVYFLEPGPAPRGSQIIYDRADSAASKMLPEQVNFELFAQARAIHLTGITPALSKGCHDVAWQALQSARASGAFSSFDINYRAKLWSPQEAARALEPFCANSDLVVMSRSDAALLFGCEGSPEQVVNALQSAFGKRIIVLTIGAEGSVALSAEGEFYQAGHPETHAVDRVGAGDSFISGLLYALHHKHDLATALRYGGALAAFKMTIPGDAAMCSRSELEALVAGELGGLRR
jgi:Sugar kinases, ribokinase family